MGDSIQGMFPEAFQTARLVLRPIIPADAQPIFDHYAQDADVTRFLTWRPHTHIDETKAYVTYCLNAAASRTYVILERASGTLIGAFDVRRPSPFKVGYGYVLARSFWGQGLVTEALTNVAQWAMGQSGIWRIGDVCDVENVASARVMEKAGLACEGILRRWAIHSNVSDEPRDCFSYAKIR